MDPVTNELVEGVLLRALPEGELHIMVKGVRASETAAIVDDIKGSVCSLFSNMRLMVLKLT